MVPSNLFSAGESMLGYLYQCRFALVESIRRIRSRRADSVSIETLDDVSFESAGSPTELLQTKHHTNPADLSDYSPDIWKSIRIWLTFHSSQSVPFEDIDHFLVTTSSSSSSSIAGHLDISNRDVGAAIALLRTVASNTTSQANKKGAELFLALTDLDQEAFVNSIYILTSQPDIRIIGEELERELLLNVREDHLSAYLDMVEGWWFRQCINNIAGDTHDPIALTSIHGQLVSIAEQFEEQNLPVDLWNDPEPTDVDNDARIFVHQLKLIGLSNRAIELAIRNYYRAYTNRSKWNREDLLLVGELEQYEKKLVEEWEQLFELMAHEYQDADDDTHTSQGRKLFQTIHFERHIRIRPKVDEESIYRGSLHILADDQKVGWHLSFRDRLRELLEVASG